MFPGICENAIFEKNTSDSDKNTELFTLMWQKKQ
jgi:hypothetical protein